MIKHPFLRRVAAAIIMALGAAMMFFAPEIWQGALLFALGIFLELLGIALTHKFK